MLPASPYYAAEGVAPTVSAREPGTYFWMGDDIYDLCGRELGPSGIVVYAVLCYYRDSISQKHFPSEDQIAQKMGMNSRAVRKTLQKLESLGVIRRVEGELILDDGFEEWYNRKCEGVRWSTFY